ncbi:GP88 family protein [Actinosynnema sp. CS-041913]|uniref:GP88 family protein n=1 Tax=Actinosynnema sp. CS-041913 TaxID=3239917 RepID=UPI003D93092A
MASTASARPHQLRSVTAAFGHAATYSASFNIRGYQYTGRFLFPAVKAKHQANLAFVLDDMAGWETAMLAELSAPRHDNGWVRIHDSGDFFSDEYLLAWLRIIRQRPNVTFYCYTKEVERFRRLVETDPPANFRWTYSYGGTQDADLDPERDHVTDVFADEAGITQAGWTSQEECDTDAVSGPHRIGTPARRVPHLLRRQAGRRFSEWQAEVDAEHANRRERKHLRLVVDYTRPDLSERPTAEPADQPRAA